MQGPYPTLLNFLGTGRSGVPVHQPGQLLTGRTTAPASPAIHQPSPCFVLGSGWVWLASPRWPPWGACSQPHFLLTCPWPRGPLEKRPADSDSENWLPFLPSVSHALVDSMQFAALSSSPPSSLAGIGPAPGSTREAELLPSQSLLLAAICWCLS